MRSSDVGAATVISDFALAKQSLRAEVHVMSHASTLSSESAGEANVLAAESRDCLTHLARQPNADEPSAAEINFKDLWVLLHSLMQGGELERPTVDPFLKWKELRGETQSAAIKLVWMPYETPLSKRRPGKFFGRHPALSWDFDEVQERKLGRRGGRASDRGIRSKFSSKIARRMIYTASLLEFDGLRYFELDGSVLRLVEQPIKLRYDLDGKWRTYTPDLYVVHGNWSKFVEIKFTKEALIPENLKRWIAIGETLAQLGYGFEVKTEIHLRAEPIRSNIETVFNARHASVTPELVSAIKSFTTHRGPVRITEINAEFGTSDAQVYRLIRLGALTADLSKEPIGGATIVSPRYFPQARSGL